MQKRQHKFKVLLCSLLCLTSMSTCKGQGEHPVLERGKPIDLARVDFQKLNLDICFSKLAYIKENVMSPDKHTNSSNKPLIIRPYFLYNITEERLLKRYEQKEVDTIEKGEIYGDLHRIERRAPLLDMRNPDTRSFGYWGSAEILFSSIFTSSTPANKLIRVRYRVVTCTTPG
jgi:hypothetical protein